MPAARTREAGYSNGVGSSKDAASKRDQGPDSGDDENGSGDDDDDEYVVEAILGHEIVRGNVLYKIKWLGWDSDSDLTWEPEENLENAQSLLQEYFKKVGGRPSATKKRKRPSGSLEPPSPPQDSPKRKSTKTGSQRFNSRAVSDSASPPPKSAATGSGGRLKKGAKKGAEEDNELEAAGSNWQSDFKPPAGSWENEITSIDTVEKSFDPVQGKEALAAYVTWNTGHQRRHLTSELKKMCPQLLISFYERHVILTPSADYEPATQGNGE